MRILEPGSFHVPTKPKKHRKVSAVFLALLCLMVSSLLIWKWLYGRPVPPRPAQENQLTSNTVEPPKKTTLRQLSAEDFKQLYITTHYPNTQVFEPPPPITGNVKADEVIRQVAEKRGYRQTSIPVSSIVKINEPRLGEDDLLQPLAAESWRLLKEKAQADSIPLSLLSAFRSPEFQRALFVERLSAAGSNPNNLAAGQDKSILNDILGTTAVPGYSRHHTGYTIDLWCEDGSGAFLKSSCFKWIKADNYKIAKETGWIPSYPEGTTEQGPEPEPWEYVWVGKENLYEPTHRP